ASPALQEWYIRQMDRTPVHCANAMDAAVAEGDVWPRLPEIRTPTLILSGSKSPIAQASEVQAMKERMPGAKLVAFESYGHGRNMTAPERCVAELRKFLGEQRNKQRKQAGLLRPGDDALAPARDLPQVDRALDTSALHAHDLARRPVAHVVHIGDDA